MSAFSAAQRKICAPRRRDRTTRPEIKWAPEVALVPPRPFAAARASREFLMNLNSGVLDSLPVVLAELNYLTGRSEGLQAFTYAPPSGGPRTNMVHKPCNLPIRDARPIISGVTLDNDGFGLVVHGSAVQDFSDDEEVKHVYYPETE